MGRAELDCDVAVIGAGTAGLVTGAALSRAGCRTIILEQHDRPGGYLSGFTRRGLPFDAAVHFVHGCGSGGVLNWVFTKLGCDNMEFVRPDPMTTMVFANRKIEVPQSLDEFKRLLCYEFPGTADGIHTYFSIAREAHEVATEQFMRLASGNRIGGDVASDVTKRYALATQDDLLSELIYDPEAAAVLNGQLCYSGLPPSRISALWYLLQLSAHHLGGSYYPVGGTQVMSNCLARIVTDAGGKIMYKTRVCSIMDDNGSVAGVKTTDGRTITARAVVSAADARTTLSKWLEPDVLPRRLSRLIDSWEPSISAVCAYLIIEGDLPEINSGDYIIHKNSNYEQSGAELAAGRIPEQPSVFLSVPTKKDPSLAPAGTHCASVITLAPYHMDGGWQKHKDQVADKIVSMAATVIPDLESRCIYREAASPLTLQRYTGNWAGSCFGLAATPRQLSVIRPPNRPGIDGLFLAGHWTFPGLGIDSVVMSGYMTARFVLDHLSGARNTREV